MHDDVSEVDPWSMPTKSTQGHSKAGHHSVKLGLVIKCKFQSQLLMVNLSTYNMKNILRVSAYLQIGMC